MALGRVTVDVTGLSRVKLLVVELNELERDLGNDPRGLTDYAIRINHALSRLNAGAKGDNLERKDDSDDD